MSVRTQRAAKVLGTSAVAALILSACGGGGSGSAAGTGTGEIDRDAILRVTTAAPSRNLDPHQQASYSGVSYITPIFDRLTMVDSDDNLVPGLATEWEFAPDGSYLELRLRDDVTFNDGTPFDASAVAANIERGKTLPGSTVVESLEDITTVDVVDARTVRLNLVPGAGVGLPGAFSTNVGMMISPRAIAAGADIRNDPGEAGSGPYVVTAYVPQESMTLARADDDYWDDTAGRLAGIEITGIPDASTRLNGVRTGASDLTWVSSANEIVEAQGLARQGAVQIYEVEFRNVLGVMMRAQGDLVNPAVRQAVARAIDPVAISALFSNTCTPYQQMYPASSWSADGSYEYPYTFDEVAAKSLVGGANSPAIALTFGAGTNTEKPANVIQADLTKAGFTAELNPVPITQAEPRYIAGDFQAIVTNSFSPKIDPDETVDTFVTGEYGFGNNNPEIAALAEQAADPTLSQDDRAEFYKQIWALTLEEALFVPICHQTNVTVHSGKVVGADNLPWVNTGIFDIRTVAMLE
ncbi:ABC transporter substrate-binding protein [Rhodococcus sp. GXMU-t2271]|uniref:ABC transporter substrate-binding protein n=1 Tax=Rhodococcus sp. GXMU-t2271 TaxID=3059079 RepID=UPI00352B775C